MKRMMMTMLAAVLVSTSVMAQDEKTEKREPLKFDKTEMVKRRTNETVSKYKLSDKQAKQLLELNTKYADTMGPGMGMGGRRGGFQQGQRPNFGGGQGGFQQGQRPEMTEEMRAQMEKMRKEREESQKKYDEELQTIMTPDQYKAYKADQEEMRRNFGNRRGGGQRRGNQNQQ